MKHQQPSSNLNNTNHLAISTNNTNNVVLIDNHIAPLTNNSTTTTTSSSFTDDSNTSSISGGVLKSPRFASRNPVTGHGIDAPFRRQRKVDNNKGSKSIHSQLYYYCN